MRKNQAIALVNSSLSQPETQFQGQGDFVAALAQQIAERCVTVLLAKLPRPNVIQQRYLTVEQAAAYIGHTKKSFEYLMTKNLFPVVRYERLVEIDREDIDRWMAQHKC